MTKLFAATFALAVALGTTAADARLPQQAYPSCDLPAQHRVTGPTGGRIRDRGQAHVAIRANILEADLGTARTARRLTREQTDSLYQRVERVRAATDAFVHRQGFLSIGERVSQDRELDSVALRLCRA